LYGKVFIPEPDRGLVVPTLLLNRWTFPLAASIGLAGMLLNSRLSPVARLVFQLGFAASSCLGVSLILLAPVAKGLGALEAGRRVRAASRRVYLLLYLLAAVEEIQYLLHARGAGSSLQDTMHGLWPDLLGALAALVLARVLAVVAVRTMER
jgi:hypothetical protein